jgi:hypothetical protein
VSGEYDYDGDCDIQNNNDNNGKIDPEYTTFMKIWVSNPTSNKK